jgi:hypothetical protein
MCVYYQHQPAEHGCTTQAILAKHHHHHHFATDKSNMCSCHNATFRTKVIAKCEEIMKYQELMETTNPSMKAEGEGEGVDWSGVEGNADLIWTIPTDILSMQLHQHVLRKDILAMFSEEVQYRLVNPYFVYQVKRKLNVSMEICCLYVWMNEYIEHMYIYIVA